VCGQFMFWIVGPHKNLPHVLGIENQLDLVFF
jgi:hypothetical protein